MHAPAPPPPPSAGASASGIACVALIGPQNQPLLLRLPARAQQQQQQQQQHEGAADQHHHQQQLLRFSYIAHCALDALEERVLLARRAPGGAPSAYLGLLYPTEEYRVYGYCSATHLKVVLVVEPTAAGAGAAGAGGDYGASPPSSSWPPDAALSGLCRRLHSLYVDAASNPFFAPGAPLEDDPRVLRGVDAALAEFAAAVGGGGGGGRAAAAAAAQAGGIAPAMPG